MSNIKQQNKHSEWVLFALEIYIFEKFNDLPL